MSKLSMEAAKSKSVKHVPTYCYNCVSGPDFMTVKVVDADNASFSIVGTSLKTAAAFNFETKSSYSIRLRATDSGSPGLTYEEAFTISVTNVNEAPADITLTPATIPENNAASATDGTLAAVDVDAADSHSFSLVAGAGDTNNANFTIDGAALKLSPSANFETQSSYSVRVQATDALGEIFAQSFAIPLTHVNEMTSYAKSADQSLPAVGATFS